MRLAVRNDEKKQWERFVPFAPLYKIGSVAQILGVGSAQIYGAINRGTMKGYTLGGIKVIKHEDLIAYIERRNAVDEPLPALLEIIVEQPDPVAVVDEIGTESDEVEGITDGLDIFDESAVD